MVVAMVFSNPVITEIIIQVMVKGEDNSTLLLTRIIECAQGIKHCIFCFGCGGIGWVRPSRPWL